MLLTDRQTELLQAVYDCVRVSGIPPTVAQLSEALECDSKGGVRSGLAALEKKGMVRLIPRIARGIAITHEGKEYLHTPH